MRGLFDYLLNTYTQDYETRPVLEDIPKVSPVQRLRILPGRSCLCKLVLLHLRVCPGFMSSPVLCCVLCCVVGIDSWYRSSHFTMQRCRRPRYCWLLANCHCCFFARISAKPQTSKLLFFVSVGVFRSFCPRLFSTNPCRCPNMQEADPHSRWQTHVWSLSWKCVMIYGLKG